MTWLARAEALADDAREPGRAAADLMASAWAARVDPHATAGLAEAAAVLSGREVLAGIWSGAQPCPDDRTLLAGAEEIEAAIADLGHRCAVMQRQCQDAEDQAQADLAAATSAQDPAGSQIAQARLGDAQAALEILADLAARLDAALTAVRRVPDDLASTYEAPLAFRRQGGVLPRHGDFLTGTGH